VWTDDVLSVEFKLYLGMMAASCYNCEYLLNIIEEQFVLQGGNLQWITHGLKKTDPRAARFAQINEILAYKPWMLSGKHIEQLLAKDEQGHSLNFQQVLTGCIVLSHYHSMCCFVQGQGLIESSNFERVTEQLKTVRATKSTDDFDSAKKSADA
jgi:hypothetical protein